MAARNYNTHPEHSSPETPIDRTGTTFWRTRLSATLERLEREARRMLQLEEDLSTFANQYYDAVGEVTERLTQVEQKLAGEVPVAAPVTATTHADEIATAMPAVRAQRDARAARRVELKTRYRSLAKEIHPDLAMAVHGNGIRASQMQSLNMAYQQGDLAALLKLEAQMLLSSISDESGTVTDALELALRDIERAADTYAEGYRSLLNSPINELMLRAMSARLAGWDWMQAVVRKVERTIEEKERAAVIAHIAEIGAWRESAKA